MDAAARAESPTTSGLLTTACSRNILTNHRRRVLESANARWLYLIKCEVYLCTTFDDNDVGNFSRTAHLAKLGETSEFVWPRELVCHTIG